MATGDGAYVVPLDDVTQRAVLEGKGQKPRAVGIGICFIHPLSRH